MKSGWIWLGGIAAVVALVWWLNAQFPGRLDSEQRLSQVVYLVALLALVAPGVAIGVKGQMHKALKYAAFWAGLLAVVFVLYTFRDVAAPVFSRLQAELVPSAAQEGPQGEIIITRGQDGHFYVDGYVNGEAVHFLVDTGASRVALSQEDARRAGLATADLKYNIPVATANGLTMNAAVRLDSVAIPPLVVHDVRASVAKRGRLTQSLLGMSFLKALNGYRVEGDQLILWR